MDTAGRFASNVPLRGPPLLRAVVNHILAHPEEWDQTRFHSPCYSAHCVAGFCQIFAGHEIDSLMAWRQAQRELGISDSDAAWLFERTRTLPEIHGFAVNFLADSDSSHVRHGICVCAIEDLKPL